MSKELSDRKIWEDIWKNYGKNIYNPSYSFSFEIFHQILTRYLPRGNYKFLELGCGGGSFLGYFAKYFGYDVYGVDYSKNGVYSAYITLKKHRLRFKGIILADIRKMPFKKESFDIVASFGLIEHFKNYKDIIKLHIDYTKKNGFIVIQLPNFGGFLGNYQNLINKYVMKYTLRLTKKDIITAIQNFENVEVLFLDYYGVWNLGVIDIRKRKYMYYPHVIIDRIVHKICRIFKIRPETKFFSPYILAILKKINNE